MSVTRGPIVITCAGGAGVSTGVETINVEAGYVVGLGVDYRAMPATTDVVVTAIDANGQELAIFSVANANTDIPLTNLLNDGIDAAGAAETANPGAPFVDGSIRINITGADVGDMAVILAILRPALAL